MIKFEFKEYFIYQIRDIYFLKILENQDKLNFETKTEKHDYVAVLKQNWLLLLRNNWMFYLNYKSEKSDVKKNL